MLVSVIGTRRIHQHIFLDYSGIRWASISPKESQEITHHQRSEVSAIHLERSFAPRLSNPLDWEAGFEFATPRLEVRDSLDKRLVGVLVEVTLDSDQRHRGRRADTLRSLAPAVQIQLGHGTRRRLIHVHAMNLFELGFEREV